MSFIPLVDLKAQYVELKGEIDQALQHVIRSVNFILGPEVLAFEREFGAFCEAKHAIGVSSGSDALHLALRACGVRVGDEVITTPFTFVATAEAISLCGARPVFADIDSKTVNLDPKAIEAKITPRTKAILPVHLYGLPADMGPILEIGKRHSLRVIEDAAQAHGARWRGQRIGTLSDAACFSFYPGKNLGAYGDGGAVVSDDDEIAERVQLLHNHGRREKYEHLIEGFGNRLDEIQAAILRVKLSRLEAWNSRRRDVARQYMAGLADSDFVVPFVPDWAEPVFHLFVVRVRDRETIQHRLRDAGVATGVHYPIPLHLQPAYSHLGYRRGELPQAEAAAREVLSLPIHPELQVSQIDHIVTTLRQAVDRKS